MFAGVVALYLLYGSTAVDAIQFLLLGAGKAVYAQAAAWGSITGTLSSQTDLQAALDGKLATSGNGSGLTSLNATQLLSGTIPDARFPATLPTASGANLTALNGANLASGTIGTARLGSGTANSTTYLRGDSTWAAGPGADGWTLNVQALTSGPTDGQTIYFGQLPKAPVTTQGTSRIYIRKAGTITIANIFSFSGTAGTNENWTCNIRLNNTGDTAIATVGAAASERVWSNSGLSIAVTTSDYVEVKCVNPTWATNPLTTIFGGYLYVQ